ncbi:zinc finger and BTB domain-containing protein 41-like [Uranotaenia lowii]|uniref:zinc finger and BTB domain-containing protein 41-like n=1 Tax=Uranotaenia lowii TaxID=190385 RepID=UPI00247B288D|nr:zinc finger and BTB domain-containing protein 41-like [Uranotaenia lowii]
MYDIKCAIPGCKTILSSKREGFGFPQDLELCLKWLQICNNSRLLTVFQSRGMTAVRSSRICASHFDVQQWNNPADSSKGLKIGTMPNPQIKIEKNQGIAESSGENKMVKDQLQIFKPEVISDEEPIEEEQLSATNYDTDRSDDQVIVFQRKSKKDFIKSETSKVLKENDKQLEEQNNKPVDLPQNDTDRTICCICNTVTVGDTKHIFDESLHGNKYHEILQESLSIEIPANRTSNILQCCMSCSDFLDELYLFARQCRKSFSELNKRTDSRQHGKYDNFDAEGNSSTGFDDFIIKDEPSVVDGNIYDESDDSSDSMNLLKESRNQTRRLLEENPKNKSPNMVQCKICGHTYKNQQLLDVHMNIHTRKMKFSCRFCDKTFYLRRSCVAHERCHEDKINNVKYVCDECGQPYGREDALQAHIAVSHRGISRYGCKMCKYRTNIRPRLLEHVRSQHTEMRPYQCTVCQSTFAVLPSYYRHLRKHRDREQKYRDLKRDIKCSYCQETFAGAAQVEKHLATNHKEKMIII